MRTTERLLAEINERAVAINQQSVSDNHTIQTLSAVVAKLEKSQSALAYKVLYDLLGQLDSHHPAMRTNLLNSTDPLLVIGKDHIEELAGYIEELFESKSEELVEAYERAEKASDIADDISSQLDDIISSAQSAQRTCEELTNA